MDHSSRTTETDALTVGGWLRVFIAYFVLVEVLVPPIRAYTGYLSFARLDEPLTRSFFWLGHRSVFFWVWALYIVFIFVKKRRSTRDHVIAFLGIELALSVMSVVDTFFTSLTTFGITEGGIMISFIVAASVPMAWIAYFLKSDRVARTFTQPPLR